MTSRIRLQLLASIQANAETGYPLESAGLLIGRPIPSGYEILEVKGLKNRHEASEQSHRYTLDPLEFFDAEEQAESQGLDVVGIFHSHPDHPARPSATDLSWALPGYTYFITSVIKGVAVETRAWRLAHDRKRFDEETLKIIQPAMEGE